MNGISGIVIFYKILDWLPLNKKDEGLNSGHVSK